MLPESGINLLVKDNKWQIVPHPHYTVATMVGADAHGLRLAGAAALQKHCRSSLSGLFWDLPTWFLEYINGPLEYVKQAHTFYMIVPLSPNLVILFHQMFAFWVQQDVDDFRKMCHDLDYYHDERQMPAELPKKSCLPLEVQAMTTIGLLFVVQSYPGDIPTKAHARKLCVD